MLRSESTQVRSLDHRSLGRREGVHHHEFRLGIDRAVDHVTRLVGTLTGASPRTGENGRFNPKSFFLPSASFDTRRLSSDWESTRLKIELSPVQIREAALHSRFKCLRSCA